MVFYENYEKLCRELSLKPQGKEMRDFLKVQSSTISSWKNGAVPRIELLCKIADFFDVSTDFLLGRTNVRRVATSPENTASSPLKDMDFALDLNGEQVVEAKKRSQHDFSNLQPIFAYHDFFFCVDKESNKIISAPRELFDPKKNPEIAQRFPVSSIDDWRKIIPIFGSSDVEHHDSNDMHYTGRQTEDEQFLIDVYRKLNAEGRARISQAVMNIYDEYASAKPKEKANASAS